METQYPGFSIEATSHCQDGHWPRWSWWIRGIANSNRYGVVGTDESGHGLYLYTFRADRTVERQELMPPAKLSIPDALSRHQANVMLVGALMNLGWTTGAPRTVPPPFDTFYSGGFLRTLA